MNPSAQGWIDKFGFLVKNRKTYVKDEASLYQKLLETGFIYGINVGTFPFFSSEDGFTENERAKINLLTALYYTHAFEKHYTRFTAFLEDCCTFYNQLLQGQNGIFDMLFKKGKNSATLENYIDSRVNLDKNLLTKNFHNILTNSLLFVDVLAFKKFCSGQDEITPYAKKLERIIINLTYHALNSKEGKTLYDEQLLKLFESSVSFYNKKENTFDGSYLVTLKNDFSDAEHRYFLNLACLAVWDDKTLEYKESEFIYGIGKDMKLGKETITEALNHVELFFKKHLNEISVFKAANPVKHFYDNSSLFVNKLIIRNKKRLLKEFENSKELVWLLTKSTGKELSATEKKKLKEQLLDLFKTIPSLAIFALPGGSILLPIFIKLVPKLLPSAFDDNRVEE